MFRCGSIQIRQGARGRHRAVDSDPTKAPKEDNVHGSEVAESHKDFAIRPQPAFIEKVKQTRAAVSSPESKDGVDLRILKIAHQLLCAGRILACQVFP